MTKVIRIDTAVTTINVTREFGNEIVRFSFDDGGPASYASVGAFPSKEILVRDASAPTGFIAEAIRGVRGRFTTEPEIVEVITNNNWTPLWVDNSLKSV